MVPPRSRCSSSTTQESARQPISCSEEFMSRTNGAGGPQSPFDYISPLDSRYYGSDERIYSALHPYLSDEATLRYQMKVEQAIIAELEARGIAPAGTASEVASAVQTITLTEVLAEEHRIHHNIRAIANCIRGKLSEDKRGYVHLFATSNDIMDTARAVCLRDVTREVLIPALRTLVEKIAELARTNAATPQIGRTHGRYAEPITVGYWLANYVERLGSRTEFIAQCATNLRGKFSGAVGAHNALAIHWPDDPGLVEQAVLGRLGVRPSDTGVSTQIVHPEYLTDYSHAILSTFSVLANLADDVRHLMRSEIEEMQEAQTYRVGSSTMPHKVNPKNFENVKSLWKAFAPRMLTLYLDQISEHQRDLTNSASGRFFNEIVAAFYYAVWRLRDALEHAEVSDEALERNFASSAEWTVAEPLYIALALTGHPDAYDLAHKLVSKAREQKVGLLTLLRRDPEAIRALELLPATERALILDPKQYLGDSIIRTRIVCDEWQQRIRSVSLIAKLGRPNEDEALGLRMRGEPQGFRR